MHPTLLRFNGFELRWYGLLVAAGFLIGLWMAARRVQRDGMAAETVWNLGIWLILGGLLGAKVAYVWRYWDEFLAAPFSMIRSGFVFYGGLLGGMLATVAYAQLRRISTWKLADALAPSLALGHALGRVGCFLEGCCYGSRCDLPWAVKYPHTHETRGLFAVHPTQWYEAAGLLALFAALHWLYPRKRFDGQIWWLYALCYSVLRFKVEFFRGDAPTMRFGFTTAQMLSAALFGVAIVALLVFRSQQEKRCRK